MGTDGTVLYVGKAKNLKKRISQYRQLNRLERRKQRLVREAVAVKCTQLASEIEALFVEAELIKEYRPEYNVRLKDDKSPIYLVITSELFPRLLMVRKTDLPQYVDSAKHSLRAGNVFGPFQSAYMLRQVLRQIRSSFGWCSRAGAVFSDRADWERKVAAQGKKEHEQSDSAPAEEKDSFRLRPCFFVHIEQCSGACIGAVSPEEYRRMIRRLRLFLRGETKSVQRDLKKQIEEAASAQEFERAAYLSRQWEAIERLTNPEFHLAPDIALPRLESQFGAAAIEELGKLIGRAYGQKTEWRPRRLECYDVSNVQGKQATVSMTVFINGAVSKKDYRIFYIRTKDTPDDFAMMREALTRRQNHPEWGTPDLVVIDGGLGQLRAVQSVWKWGGVVASLAKRPDRLFLLPTTSAATANPEIIPVDQLQEGGRLLQQARDEAHRFAKRHVHLRLRKRDLEDLEAGFGGKIGREN